MDSGDTLGFYFATLPKYKKISTTKIDQLVCYIAALTYMVICTALISADVQNFTDAFEGIYYLQCLLTETPSQQEA